MAGDVGAKALGEVGLSPGSREGSGVEVESGLVELQDAFGGDGGLVGLDGLPQGGLDLLVGGGYDGKGVLMVQHGHEAIPWLENAATGALLIEERVDFRREVAQSVARRPSGEIVAWPLVESVQRGGVCAEVIAPAPSSAGRTADVAEQVAVSIAEGLDVTGVLAVEMFETTDGRLLVNELAMRPHNSGHWSIEGSTTSQFEQHLRAVLDLPLGSTGVRDPWTVMVNVLGGPEGEGLDSRYAKAMGEHPLVKFHSYEKESRPGRKVGHVTVGGDDLDDVMYQARAAADILGDR